MRSSILKFLVVLCFSVPSIGFSENKKLCVLSGDSFEGDIAYQLSRPLKQRLSEHQIIKLNCGGDIPKDFLVVNNLRQELLEHFHKMPKKVYDEVVFSMHGGPYAVGVCEKDISVTTITKQLSPLRGHLNNGAKITFVSCRLAKGCVGRLSLTRIAMTVFEEKGSIRAAYSTVAGPFDPDADWLELHYDSKYESSYFSDHRTGENVCMDEMREAKINFNRALETARKKNKEIPYAWVSKGREIESRFSIWKTILEDEKPFSDPAKKGILHALTNFFVYRIYDIQDYTSKILSGANSKFDDQNNQRRMK